MKKEISEKITNLQSQISHLIEVNINLQHQVDKVKWQLRNPPLYKKTQRIKDFMITDYEIIISYIEKAKIYGKFQYKYEIINIDTAEKTEIEESELTELLTKKK